MSEWLELQNPWWLLLFIPLALGVFFRKKEYHIGKLYFHLSSGNRGRIWTRVRFALSSFFALLGLLFFLVALADLTRGYVETMAEKTAQRFIVWVDSSSSMKWVRKPGSRDMGYGDNILCKSEVAALYPRIDGACRAVYRIIDEVSIAGKKKRQREQDLVAIGQFATDSFVVAYLSNDYVRLREKVDRMNLSSHGILGITTNIHLAMWDMYLLALERNSKTGSGFTHLAGREMRVLARSLHPSRSGAKYAPPAELQEKLVKLQGELKDTVFIVITDALIHQVNHVLDAPPYSMRKMLDLASFLEFPVYFISTDFLHLELKRLARETGSGPHDGKLRGDFFVVKSEGDYRNIEELAANILRARLGMTVLAPVERRESYAEWLIGLGLTSLVISILLRQTVSRSLTEE